MQAIKKLILGNLSLAVFLPLLVIALATTWYSLFWSKDYFELLTGGTTFFDMQPTLTPDALFEQLRSYTEETVSFYIGWVVFDYLWPFITFTTMLFISGWLLKFVSEKWLHWFWLFIASAYLTVVMDWIENTGFIYLALSRPNEPMLIAQITLVIHVAKLVFNMVFNLAFLTLLFTAIISRTRKGRS